jgi:hypothetical protein
MAKRNTLKHLTDISLERKLISKVIATIGSAYSCHIAVFVQDAINEKLARDAANHKAKPAPIAA